MRTNAITNPTPARTRNSAPPSPGRGLLLPIAFAGVLLALALGSGGCGDDDSDSESSNRSITIEEERNYSFDDSDYDWDSPGPVARVRLEVNEFNHGDMAITIFDALGRVIFSKIYWTFDWYWYIDGEFSDLDFTEAGEPGLWTILLEYSEFTGEVTLVVETTEDVPEEPEVPPPTSDSDLLDASFGDDGRAAYEPDTAGGRRVAIDSAGRAVTCGSRIDAEGNRALGVWRFTPAGALDSTFGSGGVYTFASPDVSASGGFDLALDGFGGILVSGWAAGPDRRTDLVLVHLNDAGQIDTDFGAGGFARLDLGEDEIGTGVAVDGSGAVHVAGTSRAADNSSGRVLLARFAGNGILDPAFGDGGVARTTGDATDRGADVGLQSSGLPVVLGARRQGAALFRFTAEGDLDTTFGSGGVVTSEGGAGEIRIGRSLAIAADDTLAVAGLRVFQTETDPSEATIWRLTPNGLPLTTFNGSGFLAYRHTGGSAAASGIAFDSVDRLVVSGGTKPSTGDSSGASATLWRYFASGAFDGSLPGSGGTGVARFDPRPDAAGTSASALVFAPDGSLFSTGSAFDRESGAIDLVVWQLEP